jgi:hypothetical protein
MSKSLYTRLGDLEAASGFKQPRVVTVFYNCGETPEEGWRRQHGDAPFPMEADYDFYWLVEFVTPDPKQFGYQDHPREP